MSRMFNEHDVFILQRALPDGTVPAGTRGVVLMVFGGSPCSYEVEFPDGHGGNLGAEITYTLTDDDMRPCDGSA